MEINDVISHLEKDGDWQGIHERKGQNKIIRKDGLDALSCKGIRCQPPEHRRENGQGLPL